MEWAEKRGKDNKKMGQKVFKYIRKLGEINKGYKDEEKKKEEEEEEGHMM